jgi:hypothetical protein
MLKNHVCIVPDSGEKTDEITFLILTLDDPITDTTPCVTGIARAAKEVEKILDVPEKQVVIDIEHRYGRKLLHRLRPLIDSDIKLKSRVKLCSLYNSFMYNRWQRTYIMARQMFNNALCAARSIGGMRAYSYYDGTVVRAAFETKRKIDPLLAKELYYHPLSLFPRFLVQETNRLIGNHVYHDAKLTEQLIIDLTACFCRIRQQPFPITSNNDNEFIREQLFLTGKGQTLENSIYTLFGDNTPSKKAYLKQFPEQSRIITLSDQLLRQSHADISGLFAATIKSDYNRIQCFINLTIGCWAESFYVQNSHARNESLIDYSALRNQSRKPLENLVVFHCDEKEKTRNGKNGTKNAGGKTGGNTV